MGVAGLVMMASGCGPTPQAAHVDVPVGGVSDPSFRLPPDADPGPWRPKVPRAPMNRRPDVDLRIDLAEVDQVPWPLWRPPSMQPHLEVTATTGAGCSASSDAFVDGYASAWCLIRAGERARAADVLAALESAATGRAQEGVFLDLAEVIVDIDNTAAAMARLDRMRAPPALWDAVIATHIEDGDLVAAQTLARTQPRNAASVAVACRRQTRDASLATALHDDAGEDAALTTTYHTTKDTHCPQWISDQRCQDSLSTRDDTQHLRNVAANVGFRCSEHVARHPEDTGAVDLVIAYHSWPEPYGFWFDWLLCAEYASHALAVPGAGELAVAALENATYVSDCSPGAINAIRASAVRVDAAPELTPDLHARLAPIERFAPTCPGAPP